jgi:hypothetical protein
MRPRRRTIEALLLRYFSTTNQPERGSALSLQFLSLSRQKTPTHTHTHTHTPPRGKASPGYGPKSGLPQTESSNTRDLYSECSRARELVQSDKDSHTMRIGYRWAGTTPIFGNTCRTRSELTKCS